MTGRTHEYEVAAAQILRWLHLAETALLGHTVITFNGETGTVAELRLSEAHGLCFTVDPFHTEDIAKLGKARRFYPVSTIKHYGSKAPT